MEGARSASRILFGIQKAGVALLQRCLKDARAIGGPEHAVKAVDRSIGDACRVVRWRVVCEG